MSAPDLYTVTIFTYGYKRIVRASSERDAALCAEAVLRLLYEHGEGIGFRVEGSNTAAVQRIGAYLDEIVFEVAAGA
jgi:hypothetical protein